MLWARMARAFRAVVARERAWPPMSKGRQLPRKQLRERLTDACSEYAIGDHEVPHAGWMVGYPEEILGPNLRCDKLPTPGKSGYRTSPAELRSHRISDDESVRRESRQARRMSHAFPISKA